MRAIQISKPGLVEYIDIPEPEIGPQDILLDICYVGLCGSDLSIYRGTMPMITYPRIPGHEVSGIIRDKGERVPDTLQIGDSVMISPYTNCGVCPACRIGRINTCQNNETYGVQRHGVLTFQAAIHFSKVYKSQILNLKELALVEPLSVGYHAANRGRVSETDTVLIFGCGAVGMGVLSACVRKGATIFVVDIDDMKLEQAKKMGAHYTINSLQNDVSQLVKLTNNEGVNVVIEAVGHPDTFRSAIDLVSFAGRVVYIGYTKDEVNFDTKYFVRKELDILGARNALHVFPSVIRMLEKKEKPFESLITKVFPFEQTHLAFKEWDSFPGKVTKFMVDIKQ